MAKVVLKQTETLAVVKCYGAGANTITLNTDLLSSTMVVNGTPTVNIIGLKWTCPSGGAVAITRNSVAIADLQLNGNLDFSEHEMADTVQNTSDIVVTITGSSQVWLKLRKTAGYQSKIQPETYGPYDDVNSTTA